jgi:hypothetical protein
MGGDEGAVGVLVQFRPQHNLTFALALAFERLDDLEQGSGLIRAEAALAGNLLPDDSDDAVVGHSTIFSQSVNCAVPVKTGSV